MTSIWPACRWGVFFFLDVQRVCDFVKSVARRQRQSALQAHPFGRAWLACSFTHARRLTATILVETFVTDKLMSCH